MISAITNQGKVHFMFYRETMTAQLLIEFMERLIRHHERKVFLIPDNLRVHRSKALNDFLLEHAAFVKPFHLPSYSPDLNPDEYLNRDFKSNLNNKPLGRVKGKIEAHAKEPMEMVARQAEKIKKLFDAETVKYAS